MGVCVRASLLSVYSLGPSGNEIWRNATHDKEYD